MGPIWLLVIAAISGRAYEDEGLTISHRAQLFLDSDLIAAATGVTRSIHPPQKNSENPIFRADKPWEGGAVFMYGTLAPSPDGKLYHLWYQAFNYNAPVGERSYLCYARSSDGIHNWEKPNLGQFEYRASKDNNIFFGSGYHDTHSASVVYDPKAQEVERCFKLFIWDVRPDRGLHYAYSTDGITWTWHGKNPVLTGIGDVPVTIWDPQSQRILCYAKVNREVLGRPRRVIALSESIDGVHWTEPKVVLQPDAVDPYDTDFYGMTVLPHEGIYLGFIWVFHTDTSRDTIDVQMAYSRHRDGPWKRVTAVDSLGYESRPVFLPLGPPESWEDGMVFTNNLPIVFQDEVRFYYSGWDGRHDQDEPRNSAIGMATLPRDRYVSLEAEGDGECVTIPLVWPGGQLCLNVDSLDGEVRAGLRNQKGDWYPGHSLEDCQPIRTNEFEAKAVWKNGAAPEIEPGSPVQIVFRLRHAKLYAFRVKD